MRNVHAMLFGLSLGATVFGTGCASSGTGDLATGSSQARMVVSSQDSGTTTLHVTATDDATASVVLDKTVTVSSGTPAVLDFSAAPSTYTISADVLSGDASLGSGSAQVDLMEGETTQIAVSAAPGQVTAGGSGSATVKIGTDVAPRINGVDVHVAGDGPDATVVVQVDAVDVDGDALAFFWSGTGLLDGAVQGSSTLSLPAAAVSAAAAAGAPSLHVVVQDAQGVAAAADIALAVAGSAVQGSMSPSAGGGAALQACLDAQATCCADCAAGVSVIGAGVTANANASCVASCGTTLLSCEGS